jgi:hypothetical protein
MIVPHKLAATLLALATTACALDAAAADPPAPAPPRAPSGLTRPLSASREIAYEESSPDAGMIGSGVMVLGSAYIASLVVAARSGHEGDRELYVPVAGPWLDLAKRPSCPSERAECANEATNKVLLVGDGVLQAVGVLQVLGGFAFPEKKIVTHSVSVTVRPSVGLTQLGVNASGTF